MMKRSFPSQALVALMLLTTAILGAQTPPATESHEREPLSKPIKVKATIEAIDRSARTITLKGPKGNYATVYADQNMKRFDELKVGDTVTATYYESIVASVRKPGEPAPTSGEAAAVTPGKGKQPGATAAAQATETVTIEAIDRANHAVTVKLEDGDVVSFRVRDPKRLDGVRVGDKVDITYTAALLVDVTPGK